MSLKVKLDVARLSRGMTLLGVASLGASLALLLLLKQLPYSSVILEPVAAEEARRPPASDFSIGPIRWSVAAFTEAKALQPFRDAMRSTCGDAKGLAAGACVTRELHARFPTGDPSSEFVNTNFEPVAHLQRHLAGAPGHCLTRSAILAAELLATGTPARVVQMVPARGKGHTLVEVWDEMLGWTLVDPSSGGFVTGSTNHASAVDLLADPKLVQWRPFGEASSAEVEANRRHFQGLLRGNAVYPEPWLYLRLGERVAPWPWHGSYASVGPSYFPLGPAQRALSWAIPTIAVAGLLLIALAWRHRASARVAKTSRVPTEVESLAGFDALPPT
jgi:hypothetical protein